LGGRVPGCKIEIHDVAICVGETIESCYVDLKTQWIGNVKGLHIDAYADLTIADGYEIKISPIELASTEAKKKLKKLFFINLGGYSSAYFGEIHKTGFYVGENVQEAKTKAKQALTETLETLHTDDSLDLDDCINISELIKDYEIHLRPTSKTMSQNYTCGYHLIP
jgi:hypothetical protein